MPDDYIQQLKQIPLSEILHDIYGIELHQKSNRFYCKIRPERTDSCYIYPNNSWYDFGGSIGGDTITLVQTMEECDRKTAMQKLSDWYNIKREYRQRDNKSLWDFEWKKLGVQPDRTSKNLNICVLETGGKPDPFADITLFIDQPEQISAFEEKYGVPFNEFRKTDTIGYHNILKQRVWFPLLNEREDYYTGLLTSYRLYKQIDGENFAKNAVATCDEILQKADDLNEKCAILRRAVDDISLLKVPLFGLNPSKDLQGILDGSIRFQPSKVHYFELCKWGKTKGETIYCIEVSYDDYVHLHTPTDSPLRGIPHSAFYKSGVCHICVIQSSTAQVEKIFGEKVIKTAARFDGFSYRSRPQKTENKQKKSLSFPEV